MLGSGYFVPGVQHIEGDGYDSVELVVGRKSFVVDNFSTRGFVVADIGIEDCDTGIGEQEEETLSLLKKSKEIV